MRALIGAVARREGSGPDQGAGWTRAAGYVPSRDASPPEPLPAQQRQDRRCGRRDVDSPAHDDRAQDRASADLRPVGYVPEDEQFIVVASALGQAAHPAWYLNLRDNPRVAIQLGAETRAMVAATAEGEERERLWSQLVRDYPYFAEHQRKTSREIPVVLLRPATSAAG